MNRIQVQPLQRELETLHSEELLALFCYYFPQYTYQQARKLPVKRILSMLHIVRKEQAADRLELLDIMSTHLAKHPGKSVKALRERYLQVLKK